MNTKKTTSGSSEPHAWPHKPAQAQRLSEANDAQKQQQEKHPSAKEQRGDEEGELTEEKLVSYTAYVVAYARAAESKRDDAIMNDPYAEVLSGDAGAVMLSLFSKWAPKANELSDFVAIRTRSIDEALMHRHQSINQVVILGAGLDTRAYRMKSLSDCLVIEIDGSQEMMDRKRELLEDASARVMAKQHEVIIADLAQDAWEAQLEAKGFDAKQPTFWLLEGLLYYMNKDSNVRLVKAIDALSAPKSQLWADISGYALVEGSGDEEEALFRKHALKYGENDPKQGVLSLLNWKMDIVTSEDTTELFGREFKPMKAYNNSTDTEEDVPWFFVSASKPQDRSYAPQL